MKKYYLLNLKKYILKNKILISKFQFCRIGHQDPNSRLYEIVHTRPKRPK